MEFKKNKKDAAIRSHNGDLLDKVSEKSSDDTSDNTGNDKTPGDAKPIDSEKKQISHMAERLERKLIQSEFYKHYNRGPINIVFFMVFLSNIFINVDHGSLPGCSNQMHDEVGLNLFQFGILGSIVYGGLTLGAGVATGVFSKPKLIKPALVLSLMLNSVCIGLFTLIPNFYFMASLRFGIGFFQVFICIYMPVWADAFANEKQKSVWLTFLILASPLGIVGGFTMTSYMVSPPINNWKWSFYVQGMCLIPCFTAFLLTPRKYLDIEGTVKIKNKCARVISQKLYKNINSSSIRNSTENLQLKFSSQEERRGSIAESQRSGSVA